MTEILLNGKYKLILPDHRAARPEWKTGWEVERIESMLGNLKYGDLVIDIGTEEGDISALLAQKTGNIILFEPNPLVWPNIKAIWSANKLPDLEDYFVGFASNQTDLKGQSINNIVGGEKFPSCANGELIGNHGFKELAFETDVIRQIKIDDFMYGNPKQAKLITIDIEGSEFEALKGAEETIKKDKPFIYVSVHPEFMFRMFNQYTAELVKFVEDLGYKHEILAFDHEFHFLFKPV